jgi:ribosome maturation factor RimP
MKKLDPVLQNRLRTLIESMGCELFGHESLSLGRRMLLRIYIDRPGGVTVDDCARVSRQVSAMFDVENPIEGGYVLEVSSPGIDKPLFELAQYMPVIGKTVKLKLSTPYLERRQYKGLLVSATEEAVRLLLEGGVEVSIPFSTVEKANVVGDVH